MMLSGTSEDAYVQAQVYATLHAAAQSARVADALEKIIAIMTARAK